MKITGFEIERFGPWTGLTMPKLLPGVNVFYGANEAGKSTLMEFFRAQLYGFGGERRRFTRRPTTAAAPLDGDVDELGRSLFVPSGGAVQLDCHSGQYKLRRTFDAARLGSEEEIELRSLDGSAQGNQLLRVLVSGVDEATFNNVFAIGLDELQKLGTLGDTEAAEMLFRLSVGLDRVSIVEAIKELNEKRNKILDAPGKYATTNQSKPSQLPKLLTQREKIVAEIADARLLVRDFARLRGDLRLVDRDAKQLEDELALHQKEKRLYETATIATPIWKRRDAVRKEIDAMGTVIAVPDDTVPKLDVAVTEIEKRRQVLEKLTAERQKTVSAIKSIPVDETLRKLAPRIEVLLEEEKRIVEIDGQITVLEQEISEFESKLNEAEALLRKGRRPLSVPNHRTLPEKPTEYRAANGSDETKENRPTVDIDSALASRLEDYRFPAKQVSKSKQRVARLKEQRDELSERVKVLNDKIKTELAKRDAEDLSGAVEKASETVTQLRRRQGLAQRFSEMSLHYKDLQRANAFLLQHQDLPPWALALVGVLGVLGFLPIGLEIFRAMGVQAYDVPPIISILGGMMIVGAVGFMILTKRTNAAKLQQNQRQLSMLLSQLENAKQEAAAIDARFPATTAPTAGSGTPTIELRYQNAQQELAQLEKLIPADAQRREANQQLKALDGKLERAREEYQAATKRWNDWLKGSSLPLDWTPAQVRDQIEHQDVVGDLKKELDHRYEAMNQRIRDMRTITDRIDRMIAEADLTFAEGISYVDILGEIRKQSDVNAAAIKQRDALIGGLKHFKVLRKKALSEYRHAKRAEREILRPFGAKLPEELRELDKRHQKYRKLRQQESAVQRELDAAIGGFCDENDLGELLEPRLFEEFTLDNENFDNEETETKKESLPTLDQLLKSVGKRIDVTSMRLKEELELRGRLVEQLQKLAEDDTALRKQRELAIVDEKIERARFEWRTYAACSRMLDVIRTTYERERQPRTLAEASELLRRLTSDKYRRIWTPLGEESLLVDDDQGNTYDVSWLSRGTREQLFIALRLALASAFAQHGSILPLVLDDVLVNFDTKRAYAAAQVLQEVAKSGRQIFLFTCHEHVCRMFQKLDVPVRILPPLDDPSQPIRVLLPATLLQKRRKARRKEALKQAAEKAKMLIEQELLEREEAVRAETMRKAEVQRLVLQMQQQATAEKSRVSHLVGTPAPPEGEGPDEDGEWWSEDNETD